MRYVWTYRKRRFIGDSLDVAFRYLIVVYGSTWTVWRWIGTTSQTATCVKSANHGGLTSTERYRYRLEKEMRCVCYMLLYTASLIVIISVIDLNIFLNHTSNNHILLQMPGVC